MSAVAPVAGPEDLAATNIRLQEQLAATQAALFSATAPKAAKPSRFKRELRRIGKGLWAAVASTDAVRLEKSLVALVVGRLLVSVGAGAGLVSLAGAVLHALGVNLP